MDIALLFFLPLIGGFHFAKTFLLSRYQTAREETQRLYYRAALYGIVFSVLGGAIHYALTANIPEYEALVKGINSQVLTPLFERPTSLSVVYSKDAINARVELALICTWGFALGFFFAYALNALLHTIDYLWQLCRLPQPSPLKWINRRAIKDEFEKLLADSLIHEHQIQITLNNGKVYVGLVMESLDPASNAKSFKIQPFMSGYRHKDNGRVEYTTFYQDALPDADLKHPPERFTSFQLIIPISTVVTASGFSLQAYEKFSAKVKTATPNTNDVQHNAKLTGALDIRLVGSDSNIGNSAITKSFAFGQLCCFCHLCDSSAACIRNPEKQSLKSRLRALKQRNCRKL